MPGEPFANKLPLWVWWSFSVLMVALFVLCLVMAFLDSGSWIRWSLFALLFALLTVLEVGMLNAARRRTR